MVTLNTGREYIPSVCSGCENELICKYKDDVVETEKSFDELKKSVEDYPDCLSVKLSCKYKKHVTTKADIFGSDWANSNLNIIPPLKKSDFSY